VDWPDRLASAWQEAPSSDRPVVLEVKTDPEVAPLPPHLTLKGARSFMSAMAKGDRGAGRVIGYPRLLLLQERTSTHPTGISTKCQKGDFIASAFVVALTTAASEHQPELRWASQLCGTIGRRI
jgi:hypothetical protein